MLIRRSIARSNRVKSSDSQSNKPIVRAPDGTTSKDIKWRNDAVGTESKMLVAVRAAEAMMI